MEKNAVFDVVIVGAGVAGLAAALYLAPLRVAVITRAPLGQGSATAWAQGGLAAALSLTDSWQSHVQDTLKAGAGLVDSDIARILCQNAPDAIDDLYRWGVAFDRHADGSYDLGREAAHSCHRIAHVGGDATGQAVMNALVARVEECPSITVLDQCRIHSLLQSDGRAVGVSGWRNDQPLILAAAAVILATGGCGQLWQDTTNPRGARGEGLVMAADIGATLADLEFAQFHPTALALPLDPRPLATEALRGAGAVLRDGTGHRFMPELHPDADLAPRDVVARGVFAAVNSGKGAFLDATKAVGAAFPQRFATVFASCMAAGIDPRVMPMPVVPAMHYHMGGIAVDSHASSSVAELFALGECASSGLHGANRLASNSLVEAVVFARRAANLIKENPLPEPASLPSVRLINRQPDFERELALRAIMARSVGVLRHADGLQTAMTEIADLLQTASPHSAAIPMLRLAHAIAHAALLRTESRGGHARLDFPNPDPHQASRRFMTMPPLQNPVLEHAYG